MAQTIGIVLVAWRGPDGGATREHDDVDGELDQLGHQRWVPAQVAVRPAVLDSEILTLDPPKLSQPLPECFQRSCASRRRPVAEVADPRHPRRSRGRGLGRDPSAAEGEENVEDQEGQD